jgi:hypothetical protein
MCGAQMLALKGHVTLYFIPDPSHILKKIRNNILKSGNQSWHTYVPVC